MIIWLRAIAGVTALLSFALVILKIYAMTLLENQNQPPGFSFGLMLFFPFTMGLFFAYIAIKGKMPFMSDQPEDTDKK